MFANIDGAKIYLGPKATTTVPVKGEKTIGIRAGTGGSKSCTLCGSVAFVGTKLPVFIIFNEASGGHIEHHSNSLLPAGVCRCCQRNA